MKQSSHQDKLGDSKALLLASMPQPAQSSQEQKRDGNGETLPTRKLVPSNGRGFDGGFRDGFDLRPVLGTVITCLARAIG